MNETNNNQNKKPKISKLAIVALLCLFAGPIIGFGIFCLGELIPPSWWALSDELDSHLWGDKIIAAGFAIILASILATPILGAAAIISIVRSKGRLVGLPMAIVPTTIAILICAYLVFAGYWIRHRANRQVLNKPTLQVDAGGLVGAWFGEADLTNCKDADLITSLDLSWRQGDDRGKEWSAKWQGFIAAPTDGNITFYGETAESLTVNINGNKIIQILEEQPELDKDLGTAPMIRRKAYPIEVVYSHDGQYEGYFKIEWSWAGQAKTAISPKNLTHTLKQEEFWGFQSEEAEFNPDNFHIIPVKNVIVVDEPGRFSAWPANNGVWSWGNEIVVGFEHCYYRYSKNDHSRDNDKPQLKYLARSIDGGETWTIKDPDNFVDDGDPPAMCKGDIDFTHPDFAARVNGNEFWISYSRGKTWQGPYRIPDFGGKELTSRTDYIVNGPKDCMFFFSAKESRVEAGLQDRAFCARTTDGGKIINFGSWMTQNIEVRSVMPATVRISENEFISAMRRRHDVQRKGLPDRGKNWIDVYRSDDDGKSWRFLSKVADTDRGKRNGNPPSMVRLKDGRLCVAYGYRATPYGIRAKISADNGKTWCKEILLRADGLNWDIGYCRMAQRPDGKVVTIYYFSTEKNPEQHIAATIWNPSLVGTK